ncbi:MAG: flagellar basal body P-ring formation protein FlgA [Rhodospirillales bacterium]|nr:flagellar basal body P-ring formation protein FlgA [Rhodospirillales bacterium]USO08108.1 MAG: flagellar basal body P-ring formation protein FlgA [Rhodospirillales bacterium]
MTAYQATLKRSNPDALTPRFAGKILLIILGAMVAMGLLMTGIGHAFGNTLNPIPSKPVPVREVSVTGAQIRLGDVFENVRQNADFVLAPAPAPGEELVWNEPTLLRIATAFNLPWRPEAGDEVRIHRNAQLLDSETYRAVIRDHLAGSDASQSYNVTLTGQLPQIVVPGDQTPRVDVADFSMQPAGGTFSAILRVNAGGKQQLVNLRGQAERMVQVPVLKTGLRNGEIISEENIVWTTQKAATLRPNVIRDATMLVGATPRRQIASGDLVRDDDIEMPRMISRGDLVTMVFSANGMTLTAKGRAQEDGAMGQVIKVSNTGSNRVIEGRVTASREVTVN